LRFRLVLLVLVASLPSLLLLFVTASQQRSDALEAGQEETQRLARLVAASQSNVSGQIELVLSTIAVLPELRGNDRAACTAALRTISSPGEEPLDTPTGRDLRVDGATFLRIAVVEPDGGTLCIGALGGGSISPEDQALADATLATGQVTSGNIRVGRTGTMIVTYAAPVTRDDGEGRRAIVATLDVYALYAFAREANLPAGSFITVFDDDGVVEQQYPNPEASLVGQSVAGTPVVDQIIGSTSLEEEDAQARAEVDDEDYVVGSDDFWLPGPTGTLALSHALVGVPESVIVQRASEKFNENLGKLGIAGLVALLAAWIGADLFMGRDSETRKSLVRDLYHAFSTGSVQDLDEIIGPGYTDRTPSPGQAAGIDGIRQTIAAFRSAFPDGQVMIRELLADNDKVVARVSLSGTHIADYFGVPASGKPVIADGIETFRFTDGMIVESWSMFGPLRLRREVASTGPVPPAETPGWLRRLWRRARPWRRQKEAAS
jgi:predicted ester cyclase